MKLRYLAGLALITLAPGCIRLTQTLTLRDDGAGYIDLDYAIQESAVTQIQAMLELRDQMAEAAGLSADAHTTDALTRLLLCRNEEKIRQELARYEAFGITVDKLRYDSRHASRQVKLKLLFEDIKRLAEADLFPEHAMALTRTAEGDYLLVLESRNKGQNPTTDFSEPETAKLLQPILAGFRVDLKIRPPRAILRTNASVRSLYAAEWHFDFDKDPNSVAALQTESLAVLFKGEGLDLDEIVPKSSEAPGDETGTQVRARPTGYTTRAAKPPRQVSGPRPDAISCSLPQAPSPQRSGGSPEA